MHAHRAPCFILYLVGEFSTFRGERVALLLLQSVLPRCVAFSELFVETTKDECELTLHNLTDGRIKAFARELDVTAILLGRDDTCTVQHTSNERTEKTELWVFDPLLPHRSC